MFDIPYFFCQHRCQRKNNSMIDALLFILLSFLGCQKEATIPQHLIGIWKPVVFEPQYEDRFISLLYVILFLDIVGAC